MSSDDNLSIHCDSLLLPKDESLHLSSSTAFEVGLLISPAREPEGMVKGVFGKKSFNNAFIHFNMHSMNKMNTIFLYSIKIFVKKYFYFCKT